MQNIDVIVVGSGSAGGALAGSLTAQSDKRVLVLEAGPVYRSAEEMPEALLQPGLLLGGSLVNVNNWGYPAELVTGDHRNYPRGRGLGGSSSINGCYWIRGTRDDFDNWAKAGNTGWSYDEVLPYFVKGESDHDFDGRFHGSDGVIPVQREPRGRAPEFIDAFTASCQETGFPADPDKNLPDTDGVGPVPMNIRNGRRIGSALGYLIPAMSRPNFQIIGDAPVYRVLFEGRRAVGVEANINGQLKTFRAEEIVLAGGTFRSPQLLMLSGIGPADHLRTHGIHVLQDLPGVGQNMQDHPMVAAPWTADIDLAMVPDRGILTSALHLDAEGSALEILPFIMGSAFSPGAWDMRLVSMQAESRGTVSLLSTNPHVVPELKWNLISEEADRVRLRTAIRTAYEVFQAGPLRRLNAEIVGLGANDLEDDKSLDLWMTGRVGAGHASSTCRMGPESDPQAVVDHELRVYGVEGLRVVDTSVFPNITSRGPHATSMMIGERLAHLLA